LPRVARASAAALAAAAVASCTAGSSAGSASAVRAVDDLIAPLAAAMCGWQFRCCSLREIDSVGGSSYLTPAECNAVMALELRTTLADARAAVLAGRLALDAARAAACLGVFTDGSCSSPAFAEDQWGHFGACPDPFVGQVPIGAACTLRDECTAGSRCVPGDQSVDPVANETPEGVVAVPTIRAASTIVGACLPYVAEGETCRATPDCAPGLYCRGDTFVCGRPAAEGEPCQARSPRGFPGILRPCDDAHASLVCSGGTCNRLPRAGEPCLGDGIRPDCDPDPSLALQCVGDAFNGSGICQPPGRAGDVCGGTGLPTCAIGLACLGADGATQIGACGPPPGLGGACGFPAACGPGTVCDADTGTCRRGKVQRDGTTCSTGADCASLDCLEYGMGGGACSAPILDRIGCTGADPAAATLGLAPDGGTALDAGDGGRDGSAGDSSAGDSSAGDSSAGDSSEAPALALRVAP
jgi:hypothetical protein